MHAGKKKILAISGSTKKNSINESVFKFIAASYAAQLDVSIYDDLDKLPHFNPELDNENPPASIKALRDQIRLADGVIICTPEYVFSLPGSLKNLLEWTVSTTVFSDKPVAFIVAAASGEKAFEALDLILTTIQAKIAENSKLLIKGAKGKVGSDGEIKDQDASNKIRMLAESLIFSIEECLQPRKVSSF